MFKIRNLIAFTMLFAALAMSSCAEDSTLEEIDGSLLTQPLSTDPPNDPPKPPCNC